MSAATAFTVALKISFDHCAGRRSSNASAFRPAERRSARRPRARRPASCRGTGRSTSRCRGRTRRASSAWRVPLMNVTDGEQRPVAVRADDLLRAEPVLHRHHRRAGEAAARRAGERLEVACPCTRGSRARAPAAPPDRWRGRRRAVKSARPETRRPCSFSARACSSRRVSTDTSATRARCPASRLPIVPAPATQTRVTRARHAAAELAPAGEPGRPQDEDDRHQHADDDDAACPAGRSSVPPKTSTPFSAAARNESSPLDRERADDRAPAGSSRRRRRASRA